MRNNMLLNDPLGIYRDDNDWYDDELSVPDTCPNCNSVYDEIDIENQKCHRCGFDNTTQNQK